jgi:hypothetical protein
MARPLKAMTSFRLNGGSREPRGYEIDLDPGVELIPRR